jgi:hypothetical protein
MPHEGLVLNPGQGKLQFVHFLIQPRLGFRV